MAESLVSDGNDEGETKYFLSRFSEGEKVWVKGTQDTVWDMGTVIAALAKSDDGMVAVKTTNGRTVVGRKVFGGEEIKADGQKTGYSDMTAMRFVNEPQILENLRQRSYQDLPFTFLGPVLVAVNPLKKLANMQAIKPGKASVMNLAHPFAIAELSYQQMMFAVRRPEDLVDTPTNQTVIVSGESGAGKTVSSKLVLEHLVARSGGGDLAEAMLGSNPITESFGNAKTLRNPNSSRFGKMFRILYDPQGTAIIGATIGTYLLERSRVTTHEQGERNYHIFYELLQGADDGLLKELDLDRNYKYKALMPHGNENGAVHFMDVDKENFEAVEKSLKFLGFEDKRKVELFGVLGALLHMSSIEFDALTISGNDASKVSDGTRKHLESAANLLHVGATDLEKVFTELERKVGNQIIKSPVSAVNALQILEGVSKALYSRLFEFMVITVNQYINKAQGDAFPTIGVLDIFGFETFAKNDLEQLLINYTNEALQLTFNKQVLEAEAALYEREKLAISEQDRNALDPSQVVDMSNKLCIDLLQGSVLEATDKNKKKTNVPGILDVIHEQGRVPNPSEQKMLEKLHKTFRSDLHPNYMVIKKKARTEFVVKHYAGKVSYTTGNFLLKNVDTLPKTAQDLFLSSPSETTKAVWDAGAKLTGKKASIVSTFKNQITELNNDLNATQCSFIRCMKPNAEMHRNKGWFNRRYITVQLRNLSVPKTADVLKAGLPTRIAYTQLVQEYKALLQGKVRIPDLEDERGVKSFIAALFFAFEIPRSSYKLGLTKVFFKSGDLDKLEEVLAAAESWTKGELDATSEAERVRVIERFRSYLLKRRWRVILATMFAAQMFKKLFLAQKAQKELELRSAILIQSKLRMFIQRKKYREMLYAKKLEEERIAREKAEAERKERERLAEIARQKELEKQKQLQEFLFQRREQERKQKEKFAKMIGDFKKANKAAADYREKEMELKRKEKERLEEEERQRKEEAERQRLELERLTREREEEERKAAEAAEAERQAKLAYEAKLELERLEKEREREAEANRAKSVVEQKDYINYIDNKLKRDQEKLEEKHVMEKVVEEIMDREEKKKQRFFDDEDQDDDENEENPWFFYEDLDLEEIDNISHDEEDAQRINEALKFLDNLADDDTDEDSNYDSDDMESAEGDIAYDILRKTDKNATQATFKDYNGPFIVNVHFPKLDENQLSKRKMVKPSLQPWRQCFAFIYPAHERVLLHHGVDNTIKVQFNKKGNQNPAFVKKMDSYQRKRNVIYVSGARKDTDKEDIQVSRDLIIAFQDATKKVQFEKLLNTFVNPEQTAIPANSAKAPKKGVMDRVSAKMPFSPRTDRKDALRAQNYKKYALLNKAAKNGQVTKDKFQDILLQQDDDDEEEDFAPQLVSCIKCNEAVDASHATCPHCGAVQVK